MNPGVTPTLSGAPYFYMRGAPPANLGYFLDDIRLPALFHVVAGPSVVHPALVESVDFYAAAYPARYGRFSGGIAAGQLREATHELSGEVSVRAYDSSALLELPLTGDTSLTLAGRYSYANPVAQLFAPEISVLYWDYQARLSHRLSKRDELVVFALGSRDELDEDEQGVRKRIYGAEFHRLDISYRRRLEAGRFRLRSLFGWDQSAREDGRVELRDTLTRWQADFQSRLGETLELGAGLDAGQDRYRLDSSGLEDSQARDEFLTRFPSRTDGVLGAYTSLVWQVTPEVLLTPGVRSDLYYSGAETEVAVEPRINAEFRVAPRWTLLQGFGIASQPPTDPAPQPANTPVLRDGLQTALQSSAGVRYRVVDVVSVQLGVFQNAFFNLSDGLGISRIDNAENSVDEHSRATGSARGLELLVQRSFARRLHGYLSYTLSWSRRWVGRAEGPSLFDRRHVLSGAVGYRFDHGIRAGSGPPSPSPAWVWRPCSDADPASARHASAGQAGFGSE